jgi:hypothetical protein
MNALLDDKELSSNEATVEQGYDNLDDNLDYEMQNTMYSDLINGTEHEAAAEIQREEMMVNRLPELAMGSEGVSTVRNRNSPCEADSRA